METLKEKLEEFAKHSKESVEQLNDEFEKLAPFFLSGGYIKVREDYKIYPTTIEFYFHSEKDDGIKDPIVYHRKDKYVKGEIPYFPLMTLHAHDSGYDITFENEEEQYRASALIRAYQIWDIKHECWLKWEDQQFRKYIDSDKYTPINTQVLYLKYLLNGFPMNGDNLICWVDARELLPFKKEDGKPRQNVKKYDMKNGDFYKKIKGYNSKGKEIYEPCDRPWSFSRHEPIINP